MRRTMAAGGPLDPICRSTPLAGEYGCSDVALSVPLTLEESGVAEIDEWTLAETESRQLREAAEVVRVDLDRMGEPRAGQDGG